MKILLTGASDKSFIGRHLHKYLVELGYGVDTMSKGEFMAEDFGRLDNFKLNGDVKSDVVVHCAWIRDKDLDVTDHLEFAEMTCNFFQECANRGIRVINLGSSSEYGMHLDLMNEDASVCNPHTTYGIAKLAVTLFAKKLGFNTLRLFAVYGEGGHSFMDNLNSEKWASPSDNRHWVHVSIVCKAVERLLHAKHIYGEIINVARDYSYYQEVVENRDIDNKDDRWNAYPQRQFESSRWEADLTKMRDLLNL